MSASTASRPAFAAASFCCGLLDEQPIAPKMVPFFEGEGMGMPPDSAQMRWDVVWLVLEVELPGKELSWSDR
jgi:hypothetical protein